jgi:hypothetical protein
MTRLAHPALIATALYAVAAVVFTWPLASVIDSQLAADMGDPVFVCWVLMWTGGQVLAFLSGDLSALGQYWHGNIYYPERLTLAYSEHLAPQMLQALPILATTDNVVLAYNLVFLATFVLSGLGMFLFVRSLTGSPVAAFIAGLAFAFAPYRVAQMSHVQVMSAQWMPFVLYAYRRFFETRRRAPLVWGNVAFVAQNLSCGYYLLFFAPFVGVYVIWEMASRRLLADWRVWRAWALSAAMVLALTIPFLTPYMDVRVDGQVGVRDAGEIAQFSADTHALVTAHSASRVWGERLIGLPRPEGEGFPGLTIVLLALIGVAWGIRETAARARQAPERHLQPWHQVLVGAIGSLLVVHVIATLTFLTIGGLPLPVDGIWAVHRQADGTLMRTLILAVLLVLVSPGVRATLRAALQQPLWFVVFGAVATALLALGPHISAAGHLIGNGPYGWLVAYVPGFDGVRVPARYLMLTAMFLACLAGYGVGALLRWRQVLTIPVVVVCATLILAEPWLGPFPTNVRLAAEQLELTPREFRMGDELPPIYKVLRDDPAPVVLVEFPFGSPAWDLHSMFYAGYHRRSLVNGYSGFFPQSQQTLTNVFNMVGSDPDAAWRALIGTRATHVLVREGAYIPSQRHLVADWLRARGVEEMLMDGQDRLFRMKTQ